MTCYVVIGAHGGGTSLVAGMLDALGIDMHYNPKAKVRDYLNYEDSDWVRINAQILRDSGGNWHDIPVRIKPLSSRFETVVTSLVALREAEDKPWGFKDPRTALTIGLLHLLLPNPRYIYIERDVEGVARSMLSRGPSKRDEVGWIEFARVYYERIDMFLASLDDTVPVLRLGFEKLRNDDGEALRLAEFAGCANRVDKAIEVITR